MLANLITILYIFGYYVRKSNWCTKIYTIVLIPNSTKVLDNLLDMHNKKSIIMLRVSCQK
jgi:hypothetical protein